jgi:predicted 3-demethylubiquinone-9 3-methyltransferase (glyoxalase superfamily)
MGEREFRQKITPTLMFVGEVHGKAEEAMRHYTDTFGDSAIGEIVRYGVDDKPDTPGTVKHGSFALEGHDFAAMDSAYDHQFAFNEAISLMVRCDTQDEIDHLWHELSADPAAEQCGWLKDRFGVSWQIVPRVLDDMMKSPDRRQVARVTEAFLAMKKFDIAALEDSFRG